MYKVVGSKKLVDENGNESLCEIRDYGMSDEEMDEMLQQTSFINDKGEKEVIDLRYL